MILPSAIHHRLIFMVKAIVKPSVEGNGDKGHTALLREIPSYR